MRLTRALVAAVALSLVMANAALPQAGEQATVILRSGDRISGTLIDMGGVDFTLTVSGAERRIPITDVAVIDFTGGGQNIDVDLSGGQHVIVLRNGQRVTGRLYDISETYPLKITVTVDGAQREFSSSEIGAIVLARPSTTAAPTPAQPAGTAGTQPAEPPADGIRVSARTPWTPTGIFVRRGETLHLNTRGEIRLSEDPDDVAHSAGARSQRRPLGTAPLPNHLAGALIGRIGNGAPFPIGDQTSIAAPAGGQLFLGINDDELSDNSGEFIVQITRTRRR